MTVRQREVLHGLSEANRRLVLARVGGQPRTRFTGEPTPLANAIRHRNRMISRAVEAGVSLRQVADTAEIASVDRIRKIAQAAA